MHHHLRELAGAADDVGGVVIEFIVGFFDPGNALFLGFHGYSGCFSREDFPIIHRGQDVVRGEFFTNVFRKGLSGCITHLVSDGLGADIQRTSEDSREAERVVHLVGEVRTSGGDNGRFCIERLPGLHPGRIWKG
jgi:hypothetical protein